MRVSPIGFAFDTEDDVLTEAARSAPVTHNHPERIKGAQATALAVFLARQGADRNDIRSRISDQFGYSLNRRLADIRPGYGFEVSCQKSVPEAIIAFLEATDYESAVRNAIGLGGDAETRACIAGGIAEACFGTVPDHVQDAVLQRLPEEMVSVVLTFRRRFG
jgi:ADP-ribosylglycohydrolase